MEQNERDVFNQQMKDRETLARIDQQLQDSVKNQSQVMGDLKEIFNRIERDSKTVTQMSGDLRVLADNTKLRWEGLDKDLTEYNKRLDNGEKSCEENEKKISDQKVEFTKFQQDVKSTIRTVGWIIGGMATLATIFSGIVLLVQIFGKLGATG